MPKISATRRVSIEVSGDTVTFVCRTPTAQELSQFLNARFSTKRGKVESSIYPARAAFMDKITTDLEGATFEDAAGNDQPISASYTLSDADKSKWTGIMGAPVTSFRDLIPLSWKSSAAQQFEDAAGAVTEDAEKN